MDYSMSGSSVLPYLLSLLIFLSLKSVVLSNHLIFCCPLLLSSVFPSIRDFSIELALCIRWPKYWSFSISPSNEYSWLILFRIDWFELFAVQGTLRSLLQNHSSKASIPQWSAFFIVQLSHPYISHPKHHVWILWVDGPLLAKWCFCFLNTLSRFVIAFLPRSKCLLISCL